MATSIKQQLEELFQVPFLQQENILAIRQFHDGYNNAFCVDGEGRVIGLCACENELAVEEVDIPVFLQQLQYLNLSDNKGLKRLKFTSPMPALWHVDLSDGELEELSIDYGCHSLKWLDASRNKLKLLVLKDSYESLEYLDLSGNELREFSAHFLKKFKNLKGLYLQGNKLSDEKAGRTNERGSCLDFMKRFLADLEKGETKNKEQKILLVGNGGVGKTSLVDRLVYDRFEPKRRPTHGISLEQYHKDDLPHILNLWDFGGQDIYHATHRLFLQANAIYLALWDEDTVNKTKDQVPERDGHLREYDNFSLHYWLHYIEQHGKNSPAIVIRSKALKERNILEHPNKEKLRKRFNPEAFIEVDSAIPDPKRNGIDTLKHYLKQTIEKNPVSGELAITWDELRKHLRVLQQQDVKVLSLDEFEEIAGDYGISDPHDALVWLVTSGVVFYRKNYFEDQILLDQAWAIDAIYTIFERDGTYHNIVYLQNGRFTGADLQKIWKQNQRKYSTAEQELLVGFMLTCEICFEENRKEEEERPFAERVFFAPQMMKSDKPPLLDYFQATNKDLLYIQYQHELLHYGIIQSFIVRAKGQSSSQEIWRYGMVLKNEENAPIAIVEAEGSKAINVACSRHYPEVFEQIRKTLRELQGEDVKALVSIDNKQFVPFDKLQGWNQPFIPDTNGDLVPYEPLKIFLEQNKTTEIFKVQQTDKKRMTELQTELDHDALLGKKQKKKNYAVDFESSAKILFVQANPTNQTIIWEKEYTAIEERIEGAFVLKLIKTANFDEFIDGVEDHEPQIIHFCGHGEKEILNDKGEKFRPGGLLFHNAAKNGVDMVEAKDLENLFKSFQEESYEIKVVFLNACYSAAQAIAISKTGVFTLGTTDEIKSDAARLFAAGFYKVLKKRKDISAAINGGIRRAIRRDEDVKKYIQLFYNGKQVPLKSKPQK